MQAMDFDEGDEGRVRVLERRAAGLRQQIADATEIMAPPQRRDLDGVEAASRHAHQVFAEVTRARMAEAQAGRPGPRPFAGRGGLAVRTEVRCPDCLAVGATPDESFLLHSDGELLPLAGDAELAEYGRLAGIPYRPADGQEAGRAYAEVYR